MKVAITMADLEDNPILQNENENDHQVCHFVSVNSAAAKSK